MIVDVKIILTIIYYTYDPYSKLRKNFKEYKFPPQEQYEMYKHSFITFGSSNAGKTTFIKGPAKLYDIVHVFCWNKKCRKGYRTYSRYDLVLLNNIENFAYSLIILDETVDGIRIPAVDVLYSKGRQHGIFVKAAAHTIKDVNPKSRDDLSIGYIKLNGSNSILRE